MTRDRVGSRFNPLTRAVLTGVLVLVAVGGPAFFFGASRDLGRARDTTLGTGAEEAVPLPTRPSDQELYPHLFDKDGCLKLGPARSDPIDCGNTAPYDPRIDGRPVDADREVRNLLGFVGPMYTTDVSRNAVTVLADTVTVVPGEHWQAVGLVRNETRQPVNDVVIKAELVGEDGAVLGTGEGRVPVDALRPGEPGPFVVTVPEVESSLVAEVRWQVAHSLAEDAGRELLIQHFWQLPYGDREKHAPVDPDSGPLPYVAFGEVSNHGEVSIVAPQVTMAWLDELGRVVGVATTHLHALGGDPAEPLKDLPSGGLGDFYVVVHDPHLGSRLTGENVTAMTWGFGE